MRPDISLLDNRNQPQIILDTKWKLLTASGNPLRVLSTADLYQISTYASAYRCNQVVLLYPEQHGLLASQSLKLQLLPPVSLTVMPVPIARNGSNQTMSTFLAERRSQLEG